MDSNGEGISTVQVVSSMQIGSMNYIIPSAVDQ